VLRDAGGATDNKLARSWQWTISLWKNRAWTAPAPPPGQGRRRAGGRAGDEAVRRAPAAYQAVDFDDLIGLPLKLLRSHPEARAKWQASSAMCWSTSTRTPTPCSTSC
jgi:ATP-dependent DNA helicase Rep